MQDLNSKEIDEISGGKMYVAQLGAGAAMVGLGCLALAVAPFAATVGVAAAVGMGTAGGVLAAGGGWLISTGW